VKRHFYFTLNRASAIRGMRVGERAQGERAPLSAGQRYRRGTAESGAESGAEPRVPLTQQPWWKDRVRFSHTDRQTAAGAATTTYLWTLASES
jgi:hypothetical protein